jgi:hypothetical protein
MVREREIVYRKERSSLEVVEDYRAQGREEVRMLNIAIVTSEYDYCCFRMSCGMGVVAEEGGYEKPNEVLVPESRNSSRLQSAPYVQYFSVYGLR